MALVEINLFDQFVKLTDPNSVGFLGYPATKVDAITNWANAYNAYAIGAQDASEDFVASVNLTGFINTLVAQLPDPIAGTADLAASAFDAAFVSYWTGATFAVGIPPTGVGGCPNIGGTSVFSSETTSIVTAVLPDVLKNLLLPVFNTTTSDGNLSATQLASALHNATISSVIVLITGLDTTPAPGGPLPITNTCNIH